MSDSPLDRDHTDELIRSAIAALVATAPDPKPLPGTRTIAPARSYRPLVMVAAALLVVAGIAGMTWFAIWRDPPDQTDATQPAVTTQPVPTTTNAPVTSTQPDTTAPPQSSTTSIAPIAPSTTAVAPTVETVPSFIDGLPTPAQQDSILRDYLTDLAAGRYDDAARVLGEGGLELERRADLRPLYREYGDVDDLAQRLRDWCAGQALCPPPASDFTPIRADGWLIVPTSLNGTTTTSYYSVGAFEGQPSIRGLPARTRAVPGADGTASCPLDHIDDVREADLDGDGWPEQIVITNPSSAAGEYDIEVCGTDLAVDPLALSDARPIVAVVDSDADGRDELLIGTSTETETVVSLYRLVGSVLQSDGLEHVVAQPPNGRSFGCGLDGSARSLVDYRYEFIGGATMETATSVRVDSSVGQRDLPTTNIELPAGVEQYVAIVEPHCGDLSIFAE